jgi:hypothetical protein
MENGEDRTQRSEARRGAVAVAGRGAWERAVCILRRESILETYYISTYEIKGYLFACWRIYDILRTFVPGPKHPLANKLFDMFVLRLQRIILFKEPN